MASLAVAGAYMSANAAAISAGVAAATAAASIAAQMAQAKNQAAAQKAHNEAQREYTLEQQLELSQAKAAVLENEGKDNLQSQLNSLEAKATSRNVSGAMGAKGQSLDLLTQGMADKASTELSDIRMGQRDQMKQIRNQSEALRRGEMNRMDTRQIAKPSIMQAASAGYQGFKATDSLIDSYDKWKS